MYYKENIMQNKSITILKAGLLATFIMTAVMLAAPMMGMPKMLIGNMLAHFMGIPVALGWVAHFMIGTLIAGNYVLLFSNRFHFKAALNGALFSIIPFLMAQLIIMPMMGAGFFSNLTANPMGMVMGSLIGHIVYGITLGLLAESTTGLKTVKA